MPDFDDDSTGAIPLDDENDRLELLKRLQARSEEHKAALSALTDQVAAVKTQVEASDLGNLEILLQMKEDRVELKKNTEITEQIRDMWKAGTLGQKALVWIGGLCGGIAGIVSLYFSLRK